MGKNLNDNNDDGLMKRARFLSVTFHMPKRKGNSNPLELRLGKTIQGEVFIQSFGKTSLLGNTLLRARDKLIMVNGTDCSRMDLMELMMMLADAKGLVTIVVEDETGDAELVESMVHKAVKRTPAGVEIRKCPRQGQIEIAHLADHGLFADSLLASGDRVVAVNGVDCCKQYNNNLVAVQQAIGDAEGFLSILTTSADIAEEICESSTLSPEHLGSDRQDAPVYIEVHNRTATSADLSSLGGSLAKEFEVPARSSTGSEGATATEASLIYMEHKIREMDHHVEKLPARKKQKLEQAMKKCPHLLTSEFKLRFLRQGSYNAKMAAEIYAQYWNRRAMEYGPVDAFTAIEEDF